MNRFFLTLLAGILFSCMAHAAQPNILIIMVDDMGYSDIGCYGGEVQTPNLDRLAANGIRYSQFYNTSKCNTSRSSLLSGRYESSLNEHKNLNLGPTIGEMAQKAGYRTLMVGKNHNGIRPPERGFDRFMGIQGGGSNYYTGGATLVDGTPVPYNDIREWMVDDEWVKPFIPKDPDFYVTDAFTDSVLGWLKEYEKEDKPFLLYMAFNAPHYPVQARVEDMAKYKGRYDTGYEVIRKERYERMVEMGVIDPNIAGLFPQKLTDWNSLSAEERKYEAECMEAYAGSIDRVDQNIGRVMEELERQGELENTLIMFCSDNGAERSRGTEYLENFTPTGHERMGGPGSFLFIGKQWSHVSNTPFAWFKKTSHEGGMCTPMIMHWPKGIQAKDSWVHDPAHLVDIMPTLLDLADVEFPEEFAGKPAKRLDGVSLLPLFSSQSLATRPVKIGNAYKFGKMVRDGNWKLVKYTKNPWELYDISKDRTETKDLAKQMPEKVEAMIREYEVWAANCKKGL